MTNQKARAGWDMDCLGRFEIVDFENSVAAVHGQEGNEGAKGSRYCVIPNGSGLKGGFQILDLVVEHCCKTALGLVSGAHYSCVLHHFRA